MVKIFEPSSKVKRKREREKATRLLEAKEEKLRLSVYVTCSEFVTHKTVEEKVYIQWEEVKETCM